jgi:hypothetical protein
MVRLRLNLLSKKGDKFNCPYRLSPCKTIALTGFWSVGTFFTSIRAREMNWTEILERSGVPEPPGYHETIARIKAKPDKPRVKPSRKSKKRPKRK